MIHELKTWPEPFAAVLSGEKTYEIRRADRPFCVGDKLLLREWDPPLFPSEEGRYTNRWLLVDVTHISPGGSWDLPENLAVMGIRKAVQGDRGADRLVSLVAQARVRTRN